MSTSLFEKIRRGCGYGRSSNSFVDILRKPGLRLPHRCFAQSAGIIRGHLATKSLSDHSSDRLKIADELLSSEDRNLLDFALSLYNGHVDPKKIESCLTEVLSEIDAFGKRGDSLSGSEVLKSDMAAFSEWYTEVAELYIYFTFLDLKGDRALLALVADQLQHLLDSEAGLLPQLQRTRRWAEACWRAFSKRQKAALLQRRHGKALQQWLVMTKAGIGRLDTGKPFWESYFSGLSKVTWHDLVDGLQEQFLSSNFCPQDLLEPLRARLTKDSAHHVSRHHWEALLQRYGQSVSDVLDAVLEEVLDGISETIYAPEQQHVEELSLPPRPRRTELRKPSTRAAPGPRRAVGCDGEVVEMEGESYTPEDPHRRMGPVEAGKRIDWESYVEELCRSEARWWTSEGVPTIQEGELRLAAAREVRSSLTFSRRALLLRVATGDLAHQRPVLDLGDTDSTQPAVLVSPNDITLSPAVTKFGRGSKRKMLPDLCMTEPIASRSHFTVTFDKDTGRYSIMDAGSKWGTFLKVSAEGDLLKCGDWLRVGNAELVVRYCGGFCKSHRWHARSRQHSLLHVRSMCALGGNRNPFSLSSEEEEEQPAQVANLFSGRQRRPWTTSMEKIWQQPALQQASLETRNSEDEHPEMPMTAAPLELDFVSGPRMGERLVVTERYCTIGRAEASTIQISDPLLGNVSRLHCTLQHTAKGWKVSDNKSTNGTWRRLSCVLAPSEPHEVRHGDCLLAGVHEFKVEEAEMPRYWLPSVAARMLSRPKQS
mmetsp:Transcript_133897/g.317443  ORF Transcript_133897/g.317443 Transcript_133897/m.317443 type:complete len:766 (+) Transcript_133897:56-2353(+)